MHRTLTAIDRLTMFSGAELARRRPRGWKLTHPKVW